MKGVRTVWTVETTFVPRGLTYQVHGKVTSASPYTINHMVGYHAQLNAGDVSDANCRVDK